MSNEIQQQSPFEQIRHTDEASDYWLARELMPLLEYNKWQDFEDAIRRAVEDCAKSGRRVDEHFQNFTRARKVSGTRGPGQKDYRLTRYACNLIVMASRTSGDVAAQARTYFSDKVVVAEDEEAAILSSPEVARAIWRERAIRSFIASGYSPEWATQRADDILWRNDLTNEWGIRGIKQKEFPILTDRLHMRAFGISINEHKGIKGFEVTYKGKKLVYQGDLPPALTAPELAVNGVANTVARQLHIEHNSHGFTQIADDVDVAGQLAANLRRQMEELFGKPVVSPRNMIKEPDGGLWAQLPAPDSEEDASE